MAGVRRLPPSARPLPRLTTENHSLTPGGSAAIGIAACSGCIYDGIFIGLTATRCMLASIAVSAGVFFGVYALAFPLMANHGLWLAFEAYLLLRGLFLAALPKTTR